MRRRPAGRTKRWRPGGHRAGRALGVAPHRNDVVRPLASRELRRDLAAAVRLFGAYAARGGDPRRRARPFARRPLRANRHEPRPDRRRRIDCRVRFRARGRQPRASRCDPGRKLLADLPCLDRAEVNGGRRRWRDGPAARALRRRASRLYDCRGALPRIRGGREPHQGLRRPGLSKEQTRHQARRRAEGSRDPGAHPRAQVAGAVRGDRRASGRAVDQAARAQYRARVGPRRLPRRLRCRG